MRVVESAQLSEIRTVLDRFNLVAMPLKKVRDRVI